MKLTMRLLWQKLSTRKWLAITLSLNWVWELKFSMLTQSQSLNGLLFNEWFVFLLHLFHWLSDAFSSSSPPSIANQYSVLPLCARPPVLTLNPLLPLCAFMERKIGDKVYSFFASYHLYIFSFCWKFAILSNKIQYNLQSQTKPSIFTYGNSFLNISSILQFVTRHFWLSVLRLNQCNCVQFDKLSLSSAYFFFFSLSLCSVQAKPPLPP